MGGIHRGLAEWTDLIPYADDGFALVRGFGQAALDESCPGWTIEVDAGEDRHRFARVPRITVSRAPC